jgi:hypothetical protein
LDTRGIILRGPKIAPLAFALFTCALAASASTASAQERAIQVEIKPHGDPQIAIWLEDTQGNFIDTIMVTRLVGTFGLGNRPGRGDLGGGYLWPYGKREMALPLWAHRRNVEYDRLVFQDCRESSLGWHESHSSREPFYCRPVTPSEMNVDTITCPTTAFNTDKGIAVRMIDRNKGVECSATSALKPKTVYPPRNDLPRREPSRDWQGVEQYANINTLDAVSKATPAADQIYRATYQMPAALAAGDYVIWVEVNQEWDQNATYDPDFHVDPQLRDYGMSSIGQPSIAWKVPLSIGGNPTTASTRDYAGYGSVDGDDGLLNAPDSTITVGVPGSGAERLGMIGDARVFVRYNPDAPCEAPDAVQSLAIESLDYDRATISFTGSAKASTYEIAYSGTQIETQTEFVEAVSGGTVPAPGEPGQRISFTVDKLLSQQTYYIAVRAVDSCTQASEISSVEVTTPVRRFKTVDACFIATAAYGSKEEAHVVELRAFRDRYLAKTELGRDFIDAYYEVSPPIADLVREHESLRLIVREMLGPVVSVVRVIE